MYGTFFKKTKHPWWKILFYWYELTFYYIDREILKFDDVIIEKQKFHAIARDDVYIDKIVISDEYLAAKKALGIFSASNIMKHLRRCVSCSQK